MYKPPQVVVRKILGKRKQLFIEPIRVKRGAGEQFGHIHIVFRCDAADLVDLELLGILPDVDGTAHLDHVVCFKHTVQFLIIIPELACAIALTIRKDEVEILGALDVGLHAGAFDEAKTLKRLPAAFVE
ncbi:hypothetical protein SDC9_103661 [bioreactor metagenome]|uniref:Uncharacterized protein n=1 Tax=bioreactor metagenome TaxID=1076179 RepID=A0A645AUB0_9ZZZZ